MKFTKALRPYQLEAKKKWLDFVEAGGTRGMLALATGLGKTFTGLSLVPDFGRTLWIAHRDELIEQPLEATEFAMEGVNTGVVKAERDEVHADDLVLASVQTISRQNRMDRLIKASREKPFKFVVVDEGHHAAADSYLKVIDNNTFANTPTLALSATPERHDSKGLAKVWGAKPIYRMSINDGVEGGWLVPYKSERVCCPGLDLKRVGVNKGTGDYDTGELDKEMVRCNAASAVAHAVYDMITKEDRKTLVFAVSVNQSQRIAALINDMRIPSAHLCGETPLAERRAILDMHKKDVLKVVVNCGVLTEGYNDPSITCIVVARPTMSRPFYVQVVGRGFRPFPGKNDCLILDLVGAHKVHGLITSDILDEDEIGGDDKKKRKQGDDLDFELKERDGEFGMVKSFTDATGNEVKQRAKKPLARARWLTITDGLCALSAGEQGALILRRLSDDLWTGYRLPKDAWSYHDLRPIMRKPASAELACGVAEDRARTLGVFGLSREGTRWRSLDVTDGQKKMLIGSGVTEMPVTRGDAADMITTAKLRRLFGIKAKEEVKA